ncbi:DUF6126 family protein [Kitasatospora sp. Root107]|uniref:DUF6126 family protein n=1 Tax=Kitasatospora sp. Root107 TaxID=1736424 RepID=UPI000AC6B9D5|nr:DUF6126 family protein [Kitasatospora sp. Root107]
MTNPLHFETTLHDDHGNPSPPRVVDPAARKRRPGAAAVSDAIRDEKSKRKAMIVRACIYIAGTHLFAGFVILLFALGNRH